MAKLFFFFEVLCKKNEKITFFNILVAIYLVILLH